MGYYNSNIRRLSIIYGVNGLHEISMYEDAMASFDKMTSSFLGQNYLSGLGPYSGTIEEIDNKEKIRCLVSVLSGIVFSILGTMMLKKERDDKPANQKDTYEEDRPFIIQADQKKVEREGDARWMPPEMREQIRTQRKRSSFKI